MRNATTTITPAAPDRDLTSRDHELRGILEGRRQVLVDEVQARIGGVRAESAARPHEGQDDGEAAGVEIQDDIEFALIQMKAETLNKVNEALARLEDGRYGYCFECGDEIAEARLRALPFAVRCRDCEETLENARLRERSLATRATTSLFELHG